MQTKTSFCPRLIEVALPIREISAESVRDTSLRHGHIRTLHLWWARRPLSAARAIVFASLVPDPDDERCPADFLKAVVRLLKTKVPSELKSYTRGRAQHKDEDPYRPYDNIPDTPRNRLLMFVAKWSPEAIQFETGIVSNAPKPEFLLDVRSLVRWETSDPENSQGRAVLEVAHELIRVAGGGEMPAVLDPFSGGGAIPLEAGRLGCHAFANDYNPVAYLILKATCEYPQKYGKPGKRPVSLSLKKGEKKRRDEENAEQIEMTLSVKGARKPADVDVPNVLVHDLEKWANWILERARAKIGHLYPAGKDGRSVIGYLWARTAPCSNPSCRGEMPLLRSLLICNKKEKKVALTMDVHKRAKRVDFGIAEGREIKETEGPMQARGNARCPYCEQISPVEDIRRAGCAGKMGERMVAVIVEGDRGKEYRAVIPSDFKAFEEAQKIFVSRPAEFILPEVAGTKAPVSHRGQFTTYLYGMSTWGSLFNHRQLVAAQTFIECLREALDELKTECADDEYRKALGIYLGLWFSRIIQRGSNVGIWDTTRETMAHPFGRQAIPMTWDYPEANPFSESTGGASGGIDWMVRVIAHESFANSASVSHGDAGAIKTARTLDAVVTDPPYFDAIAYSDLSDYFYVWLKRAIGDLLPDAFATPLTPKSDEATALKHRHGGDSEKADEHFTLKLSQILSVSREQLKDDGIIAIMFAHQSTKAWSALIKAIFEAGLTITSTWPIDTELTSALKAKVSALSSSITVGCRRREVGSAAMFKEVRREISVAVKDAVKRFWAYGLRGADLIVACYGPAVGVFGRHERVERADGSLVTVPELLDAVREAARDAIAGEFRGDNLSTLYYVWTNLYGVAEQDWDDARLVVQIGGDAESAMEVARGHDLFVVDGSKCRLALFTDRKGRRNLGTEPDCPLIDSLHRSMRLWQAEERRELVTYLHEHDLIENEPFWRLGQALFEVMPRDTADWKLVSALLSERKTLIAEARKLQQGKQEKLF